ncbi:MAG TPA: DUF4954 family protein, partial [Spirochaetales bacterium]|nr:DUF4954 family protein [Spirochaetales bacterium]
TVSCCELLNNLIFPAHEQHHNTSFLVAAVVKGQSNMAAGATLGSNHNSRANDGELEAGRGFWPGLSVSVKHSSRFASYCLLSKGDYHHELNVPLPFALVADNAAKDRLEVMPAYWWMYNMYALLRNETKFLSRDTRQLKNQHIEFSPFAPDIAEEMFDALYRLQLYTGRSYYAQSGRKASDDEAAAKGKELLRGPKEDVDALEIRADDMENSSRPVVILKARRAYKAYRHMLRFYAVSTLIAYFSERPDARFEDAQEVLEGPRVREWDNLGGQIVGRHRVENLVSMVKSGELGSWDEVHAHYDLLWSEYALEKAQHAWATLCELKGGADLWKESFVKEICRFSDTTAFIEEQVLSTRAKDFANEFRRTTFRGEEEMRAVLGSPEGSSFVRQCRADMERWRARVDVLLDRLTS